jgi:hypothetical protein
VGIHGSAHYFVTATLEKLPNGSPALTQLIVYGSSSAFDPSDTFLAASISVVTGDSSGKQFKLGRPTAATVEPNPAADETVRLYLPEGTSIQMSPGTKIKIIVSATKSGCSLNSSAKVVDLEP